MKKKKSEGVGKFATTGVVHEDSPLRPPPSAITHSPLAEGPAIRHLLDFEDMQVWQDAQDLAVAVYEDTRIVKDFSFVDQIKRAAVSISNNIAEGAERVTPSEFARFLDIAKGSAGEVRSMYRLACRLKFVNSDVAASRCEACKSISRQLGGFAKHLRARRTSE
jgi:four helix bundle protein